MGRLLPTIRCSLPLLCCLSWSSWFLPACHTLPLCTDSRAPVALNGTLCFYLAYSRSSSCCAAATDAALPRQFEAMNISDAACAGVVKSVLYAKCHPFSAESTQAQRFGRFLSYATIPLQRVLLNQRIPLRTTAN